MHRAANIKTMGTQSEEKKEYKSIMSSTIVSILFLTVIFPFTFSKNQFESGPSIVVLLIRNNASRQYQNNGYPIRREKIVPISIQWVPNQKRKKNKSQ